MVAIKVASLPFRVISVITVLPFNRVSMDNPVGVGVLSGEIALVMAVAVLWSSYSRVIVAFKFFAF